jgi:hypothetical protein
MLITLVFGAAGGVVAGFCRARIFGLAPVILLVGVVAIAYAGASGRALPIIGLGFLAAITALQVGYVIVGYLSTRTATSEPPLFRALQQAIGNELKTLFAPPQKLPPEMVMLLERLDGLPAA